MAVIMIMPVTMNICLYLLSFVFINVDKCLLDKVHESESMHM